MKNYVNELRSAFLLQANMEMKERGHIGTPVSSTGNRKMVYLNTPTIIMTLATRQKHSHNFGAKVYASLAKLHLKAQDIAQDMPLKNSRMVTMDHMITNQSLKRVLKMPLARASIKDISKRYLILVPLYYTMARIAQFHALTRDGLLKIILKSFDNIYKDKKPSEWR